MNNLEENIFHLTSIKNDLFDQIAPEISSYLNNYVLTNFDFKISIKKNEDEEMKRSWPYICLCKRGRVNGV